MLVRILNVSKVIEKTRFPKVIKCSTLPVATTHKPNNPIKTASEVEDDVLERLLARHRNEQARISRLNQLAKIN